MWKSSPVNIIWNLTSFEGSKISADKKIATKTKAVTNWRWINLPSPYTWCSKNLSSSTWISIKCFVKKFYLQHKSPFKIWFFYSFFVLRYKPSRPLHIRFVILLDLDVSSLELVLLSFKFTWYLFLVVYSWHL